MKAMVLHSPGPVETAPLAGEELPLPELGPGEVLVRVRACGVCHTDLHTVEGELVAPSYPVVPGHQVVGVVERGGEGASRFAPGERVGLAWLHEACGRCGFCERGRENLCSAIRFTGLHAPGGYAQFVKVAEKFAYRLPEGYTDQEAAPLLCAGIIGYRCLRRCALPAKGRLGLFGFGASAHLVLQMAAPCGHEVYVLTRNAAHQKLARELGAAWTGGPQEHPPRPIDAGIIFHPAGELVGHALACLQKGGTMVLGGVYMSLVSGLDYQAHLYQEKQLVSVANATRADGEAFFRLAREIPLRTATETFPLEAANLALQKLKARQMQAAGVLLLES